jgi:hypothetical protein
VFCEHIRDGMTFKKALGKVYGYWTLEHFETAWKKWLVSDARKSNKLPFSVDIPAFSLMDFGVT